ncbi:hypothetical protein FIBSPDRAFT_1038463 [Athelia psychrophila]|uniref:J domain-containing protein n=1 Tax=Athelia psychrophila TaxID=1759441 RepID=A0A166T2J4_9AGAM|nr:hypothetical protein FIBSPDRAFT_1038463 [Fibularhizoctonia sp. CBS 109695]
MYRRLHHALSSSPARFASTSSASTPPFPFPFPYPPHPNPKPHEIFHLSRSASQPEIKSRYIDLVRAHHPDSAHCRHLPPNERHARFQSIAAAYDHLRGRPSAFGSHSGQRPAYAYGDTSRQRTRSSPSTSAPPNGAHGALGGELLPIVLAVFLFSGGVMSIMTRDRDLGLESPAYHLAEARREAQEHGQERRSAIRREARKYQILKEEQERYKDNSCQSGPRSPLPTVD